MNRWPLRVQQVVVYGAFAVILVTKGHLDSFLDNGASLAKGVGMIVLGVVGLVVTQRLIRRPWLREGVRFVPIALVAALVLAPTVTDKRVDEALPVAVAATTPTTLPPVPVRVATIAGIGHRASGRAALHPVGDSSYIVRLEDFSVENGPDYHVYVVPGLNQRKPAGGTHLDSLKGSSGNQNYVIPTDVDVSGPYTVLIWCRRFSVPVANASLA